MTEDESQQHESQPREQQRGSQSQQHIRPRIQRKSPKKQDISNSISNSNSNSISNSNSNNDKGVAATVAEVEVEETRIRMESWMGVGSNSKKSTSNNQKDKEKEGSANEKSINNNKNNVVVSNQKPKPTVKPKQRQQQKNKPVSILKSPKYSGTTSQVVAVEASSALASTTRISVGGSVPVVRAAPSKDQPPNKLGTIKKKKSNPICQDFVVERDPSMAATKRKTFRQSNKKNKDQNDNDVVNQHQQPSSTSAAHYASIEGYVPASSSGMEASMKLLPNRGVKKVENNDQASSSSNSENENENDEDPLVIDSLEELMLAAGEKMPDNPSKITKDTKMVEANISFSVMTQDQYDTKLPAMKEEDEEERKRQVDVFMGRRDIFGDDDENIEGAVEGDGIGVGIGNDNGDDDDDDDDADAIMELLLGSDIDADDENDNSSAGRQPEVRAFTLLWDALTTWMTHDTVVWVKALRDSHQKHKESTIGNTNNINATASITKAMLGNNNNSEWSPMVDRSDIGASRCAGVLAMIRLYIGQCMEELNHPLESRRNAEKRLNDIMRTFDYSRENPKLTAGHWKAMACILLDTVLIETREADSALIQVPSFVANIGMSKEEFEYLSRKAVLTFEQATN
jgi:hypothetical protein